MTVLTRDLAHLNADELYRRVREAKTDETINRADETTLFEAWFRQACKEGNPPDKLDRSKPHYADIHRFWELVDTETSPEGCWLWLGGWTRHRYPQAVFSSGGRTYRAKRFAYEIDYGEVPPDLMVVPLCGDRACVRPSHLEERPNPRYRATKQRWTKERLIAAQQAFYVEHGRSPTTEDWKHATDDHPGRATLVQHFGSISAARRAAGLPEKQKRLEALKTHCKRGHEFTPENTYMQKGNRLCRACDLARSREHHARKKAA